MRAYREPIETVLSGLTSDSALGLSSTEVQRRFDQFGPNRLDTEREIPWWKQLLAQFQSFLIMILMVATAISAFEWLLEDPRETALPYEAIVILAIVVLNALIGFIQEARAARSVAALKHELSPLRRLWCSSSLTYSTVAQPSTAPLLTSSVTSGHFSREFFPRIAHARH